MRAQYLFRALASVLFNTERAHQSSAFLAAHLGRQKLKHFRLFAKTSESDPLKSFLELTSDAHHGFLKLEIVSAMNKLSRLEEVN